MEFNLKRKRDENEGRIPSEMRKKVCLLEFPREIKRSFTQSIIDNDRIHSDLILRSNKDIEDEEINCLLDECEEITNELELFAREKRKVKMIKLMSQIASVVNDTDLDTEELTDILMFGKSRNKIEKDYLKEKRSKTLSINNMKLCEMTNRMLEEDDRE